MRRAFLKLHKYQGWFSMDSCLLTVLIFESAMRTHVLELINGGADCTAGRVFSQNA